MFRRSKQSLLQKWTDEYLRWNPIDWSNITQLNIPSIDVSERMFDKLFFDYVRIFRYGCPMVIFTIRASFSNSSLDRSIIFSIEIREPLSLSQINARINHDGIVEIDLNKVIDIRCQMDLRRFPFDIQNCSMHFGISPSNLE